MLKLIMTFFILFTLVNNNIIAQEKKSPDYIIQYLVEHGFNPISTKIIPNPKDTTTNPLVDKKLGSFSKYVIDYANLTVYNPNLPTDTVLFKHSVEFIIAQGHQHNETIVAFITKNENFEDGKFKEIENKYDESIVKNTFWWHIWDNPNPNEDDYFCVKRKDMD